MNTQYLKAWLAYILYLTFVVMLILMDIRYLPVLVIQAVILSIPDRWFKRLSGVKY